MILINPHHELTLFMSMPKKKPVLTNVDLLDEDYKRQVVVVTRRSFDREHGYQEITTTAKLSDVIAFIESQNVSKTTVVKPPLY